MSHSPCNEQNTGECACPLGVSHRMLATPLINKVTKAGKEKEVEGVGMRRENYCT